MNDTVSTKEVAWMIPACMTSGTPSRNVYFLSGLRPTRGSSHDCIRSSTDWTSAHDTGDETAYEAAQRLLDL